MVVSAPRAVSELCALLPRMLPSSVTNDQEVSQTPPNYLRNMVPRVGFEPTAYRLRSGCSTAELPGRRDRMVCSRFEGSRQAVWRGDGHFGQGRSEVERSAGSGRDRQRRGRNRPGRCAPGKGVEGAAAGAQRTPFEAFPTARRADVTRIGCCADGAV